MNNYVYILCAVALLAVAFLYWLAERRGKVKSDVSSGQDIPLATPENNAGCCGKHLVCEKIGKGDSAANTVIYFDDEELDLYRGRDSGSYNDNEVEEFRYILYTMQQDEVDEWMQSLYKRGIELPDQLKEEAFFMMNETV